MDDKANIQHAFQGEWFDGKNSQKVQVSIQYNSQGQITIKQIPGNKFLFSVQQEQLEVSSRLGNSPRYLTLPEGQSIETHDNDSVDQLIEQFRPSKLNGFVHRIESNYPLIGLSLVLVLVVAWLTVQYGIPTGSRYIANQLPASVLDKSAQQSLDLMDEYWLSPSQLPSKRQEQLLSHFQQAIAQHQNLRIDVGFRKSEFMGANAFALPNGQVIFTDEIVHLSKHDDELLAILAHEIGHVKFRHSMRSLIEDSLFVFLLALISGDVSGTAEIVLAVPVLFAELAYSRSHETESDLYAKDYMLKHNIPLHRFKDIMLRLEASMNEHNDKQGNEDNSWQGYLSTHPMTLERVKAFEEQ